MTFNLSIKKELTSQGSFYAGSTVTFRLTPHNDGPADALGGWSIVELPEDGLKITGMPGSGYTCDVEDAGLVTYDLTITKERLGDETVQSGKTVTFTLTPHNAGPSDVLAGWTVTDRLPAGLTLVKISGDGYTCAANVCTAAEPLASGADGNIVTVVAKIGAGITGTLVNVAVVAASPTDVPEPNTKNNTDDAPVKAVATPLAITGASAALWTTAGGLGLALLLVGLVLVVMRRRLRSR